ncbi:MAG: ABC transporter transmembrane domain-containing protein [Bacteriovoracaceae bacterium]|nr:ABC transporter transmembrane domain-containing protein [Bacteriovoracaceae bacterium]
MQTQLKTLSFWQRIFSLAKTEKPMLILGFIFLIFSSGSNLLFPQAIKYLVDGALSQKNLQKLNWLALAMVVIFGVQAISSALRYYCFTLAGERIVLKLKTQLFQKFINREISFFDFHRTGDLISRLSSDTVILQNAVSVNISMGLRHIVGAIGAMVLMFYTSWKLALVMILVIPPVAIGAAIFGKKIKIASRKSQATLGDSVVMAEESLSGIRTVRSFSQEDFESRRYEKGLIASLSHTLEKIIAITWFVGLASLLGYLAVILVVWMGGMQVVSGTLSVGELTQFLIYLLIVAFSVGSLGSLWGDYMSAAGAAMRIFEILDLPSEKLLNTTSVDKNQIEGKLRLSHIKFSYPSRSEVEVLKSISFEINAGEVFAIVGPSGSGKSTIASLVSGFYRPSAGEIYLDDRPFETLNPKELRKQIGLVSQEPVLISSSIRENIAYGKMDAGDDEISKAAEMANALTFIKSFPEGFNTLVGEKGIQLSGGQKQRIAIARAILKNPKILILDEATSALDSESEFLVQEALQRLMKNRTTLVIAHRLSTIQMADQILVMEGGVIVQKGNHAELLSNKNGLYYKLIEKQIGG